MGIIYAHSSGLAAVSYDSGRGTYSVLRRYRDGWKLVSVRDWKKDAIQFCDDYCDGMARSDSGQTKAQTPDPSPGPRLRNSLLAS